MVTDGEEGTGRGKEGKEKVARVVEAEEGKVEGARVEEVVEAKAGELEEGGKVEVEVEA